MSAVKPFRWQRSGQHTTHGDVERERYAAGEVHGIERALSVVEPLLVIAGRILALAPDEVEADQVLARVEADVCRLREGPA